VYPAWERQAQECPCLFNVYNLLFGESGRRPIENFRGTREVMSYKSSSAAILWAFSPGDGKGKTPDRSATTRSRCLLCLLEDRIERPRDENQFLKANPAGVFVGSVLPQYFHRYDFCGRGRIYPLERWRKVPRRGDCCPSFVLACVEDGSSRGLTQQVRKDFVDVYVLLHKMLSLLYLLDFVRKHLEDHALNPRCDRVSVLL